ncbi:mitochondrial dynamics protein MID49 [Tachyglossus aculeatus]|uniref:mitochondrial dynamics protein MID49 n=1 Tax=Tachyglossus aculeatus TaxID=9261 RepID=UPI0018F4983B|nr:mitochondrial dynamics protein MID49 [Tachyglossus aculeatus]
MAQFSQKRGQRRDDDGLGSAVDFFLANARLVLGVSGAAILGIATLAVKRLIDRATSAPDKDDAKAEQKSIEESWQELSLLKASPRPQPKPSREALNQPQLALTRSPPAPVPLLDPVPRPSLLLCLTLQEKLLAFYRDHVVIPEAEVALARQLATDICRELQGSLRGKFPALPWGSVFLSGSLFDGLEAAAGAASRACLMAPLALEAGLWDFIPGEDTIVNDPRCWMIRRTQLEFAPRGCSPWDRFTVGGYLSSDVLNDTLHGALVGSVNWPAIGSLLGCVLRPAVASEELTVEVRHDRLEMSIALFPMAETEDKVLLAVPREGPVGNLWRQSFYLAETTRLRELDGGDGGVRRRCLRLLKGVCRRHPALSKLRGSHLAQVILRLSEAEPDWTEDALADRFRQVIEELIGCLEKGALPCYFDPRINLFGGLREEEIDDMGYTLYSAVSAPEILL